MLEYCEEFRLIESQIYDMAFTDRVLNFSKPIPVELALHIRNSNLRSKDMEVVYQLARQWATSAITSRALQSSGHHRSKHRESNPLLKFRKKHRKPLNANVQSREKFFDWSMALSILVSVRSAITQ